MVQRWVDQPGDALSEADEPAHSDGPDLVDLVPAGRLPQGYLPILQAYDHTGDEVTLVHADDERLRRMAVFDVVINNADRKGGHILTGVDGGVYGGRPRGSVCIPTTSFAPCCGGWAGKPVDDATLGVLARLGEQVSEDLGAQLGEHITRREVAALRARIVALLDDPVMPTPDRHRPIPWPAF